MVTRLPAMPAAELEKWLDAVAAIHDAVGMDEQLPDVGTPQLRYEPSAVGKRCQ